MKTQKKFVDGLSKLNGLNRLNRYAKYLPVLALAAVLAALAVSSFCTHTPENCADGQELKPGMFCFDNKAYKKCGGSEYIPYTQFCSAEAVYDKCNGNNEYDPLREFCSGNRVVSKCGGGGEGGAAYNPETQGCVNGIVKRLCGSNHYDTINEFCFNNRIYNKCNGAEFDPMVGQCDGENVQPKCGTGYYNYETQFCYINIVYPKCNGEEYNPSESFCENGAAYPLCGGRKYDPSIQTCDGTRIIDIAKCNGLEYDGATSFCNNNTIYPKCGGQEYDPSIQTCNGTSIVDIAKCNGLEYDGATSFCYNNSLYPKCGGREYDPSRQSCNGTNIVDNPSDTPRPKYTVYFNNNGGADGVDPPRSVTEDSGKVITLPVQQTMAKDGFSFGGWSANGTNYDAGAPYMVVGAATLYARWIPIHTISFNDNGATGGDAPNAVRADSGKAITLPGRGTMSKNGFSFGWWNTKSDGTGADFRADSAYTVTGNITLYARWVPIYAVTFNGNGTTAGVPGEVRVDSGTVIKLPNAMTRDGYSFGYWSTANSGTTGTNYGADSSYKVTNNITIYARWIPIRTVTFSTNNATSGTAPGAVSVDSGTVITLPGQGNMVKTNAHFGGWSTSSSGGTNYPAGSSYTVTGNVTLYARWTAYPIYTVTYNGNGATSGSVTAMSVDSGSVVTIPGNGTMVKTGYNFSGWNTNSGGTGTNYNVGASYTVTRNDTLYAKWTAYPTYTVTYNGNGATSGSIAAMSVDSGSVITIPNNGTMVKTGYNFSGWNTNSGGTGTNYSAGTSYTVTRNDTLYAKWTYTVTFDGNGVTSDVPAAVSVNPGSSTTLPSMTGTGYTFEGWNTNSSGTGTNYAAGSSYMVASNITLYAKWTVISYTVTFNGNGVASGIPAAVSVNYGSSTMLPSMTRTGGYAFAGWNTNSFGTGYNYDAGSSYFVTGNITLYARWITVVDPSTVVNSTFTDIRNSKTYKTVKIGGQTWMAENLNYQTSIESWCYENSADSCNKYGRLYTWAVAKTACPIGWKLPDTADWRRLNVATGPGSVLKSTSGWYVRYDNGTDTYGFSALPGGSRSYNGTFDYVGSAGLWWTATTMTNTFSSSSHAYFISANSLSEHFYDKSYGLSVRCVQDE